MNGQSIMDALGFLDDDLIEATGKLRHKKRGYYWLVPAVTAACLCVILIAAIGPTKKAAEEMLANDGASIVMDSLYGGEMQESPMENAESAEESATVIMQVTEINDSGFSGSIADLESVADMVGDADLKGATIAISCSNDVTAALKPGDWVRVCYKNDGNNSLISLEAIKE